MRITSTFAVGMRALAPLVVLVVCGCASQPEARLESWREGPERDAIVAFVSAVTTPGSPDFVREAERIAVFDNDGTLWVEQPVYTQLAFVLDRVRELAPQHPEWREQEPFRFALEGDRESLAKIGKKGLLELVAATHGDMTAEDFAASAERWLGAARHPRLGRPYTELVYQPMLELLAYLRAHGFETWIVSGGGVDFMRPWTERVYGIPPQQVMGSRVAARYEVRDGVPTLLKTGAIEFVDDGAGKPVGIWNAIGRRPIAAFGNSDGDFEMLEWTTAGPGRRLALLVHHDDGEREYAYDRDSHVGKLARGLDEAAARGWLVVSMREDWERVFPHSPAKADAPRSGASATSDSPR